MKKSQTFDQNDGLKGYRGLQGVTRGDRGWEGVTGGYNGLYKLFSK